MSPIGNPSRNARKRNPTAAHRRALELLAIADGATEAILLAHGFTIELMVELIRARLATQAERLVAGSRTFDGRMSGGRGSTGWLRRRERSIKRNRVTSALCQIQGCALVLVPRLAVAAHQVVHGVSKVCEG
jgi:hypothetical protein